MSIVSIIRTSVDFGCHWLLQQKTTDILLLVGAFSIGGLAGSLITQKDPAGAILQVLKRRGLVFVLTSVGTGFVVTLLWEILRQAAN
jgi:hypothetical protein